MKWIIGLVVLALAGGITWAVIADNRWQHRCSAAGGHDEQRFEGMIPMYGNKGQLIGMVPNYSDHCIVGGREVRV